MRTQVRLVAGGAALAAAVAVPLLGGSVANQGVAVRRAASHEVSAYAGARAPVGFDRTIATFTSAGPNVRDGVFQGESPAARSLPGAPIVLRPPVARDFENLAHGGRAATANDPVVQAAKGGANGLTSPLASFDGQCLPGGDAACDAQHSSDCSCLPPDTDGQVGGDQFVQAVNSTFAVFSKTTGAVLKGATDINALWANAKGECKTHNDGDPIVLYDQLAKRWLISEFLATPSGSAGDDQYGECIAVSTTSDATGTYYLYEFDFGNTTFFDYPKLSVWPDAYYMTANAFDGTTSTGTGSGAFAFERDRMLHGKAPRVVFFDESNTSGVPGFPYYGQLPGNLDGLRQPPAGTPGIFAEVDDPNTVPDTTTPFALRLWYFHVDWTTPANSTFGSAGTPSATLPVAAFVRPQCTYGDGPNCAPQKGGPEGLDVLGDRLMFRLVYRNFGDHEALVLNHTVVASGTDGIRWYEIHNPLARSGQAPTIYQQGTYAPSDTLWRWMGSIALDRRGDIALGYSASSPTDYPSIRYTGRLATDPAGQMTQAEQTAYTGKGPQTEAEGRWGDYSQLSVDPADDCTFYYTQEYLDSGLVAIGTWRTRVVSFKFPACSAR